MVHIALAALLAAQELAATPPATNPDPATFTEAQEPLPPCCVLRALTPVILTIDEPVDSDKSKIGQYFKLSLRQPLEIADGIVIPAGTPGGGQVVHAAKSRAMGKAGELILAARYLDYQGIRITLRSFRFGKGQGKDNVDTAAIVGFAVSPLITPFITGGEVRIPAGTAAEAKVSADTPIDPSKLSPPAAPAVPTTAQEGTQE